MKLSLVVSKYIFKSLYLLKTKLKSLSSSNKRKLYSDIQKFLTFGDIQILLFLIQTIGYTFQVKGFVASKAGSGKPILTAGQDDRRLEMAVLQHRNSDR